MLENREYHTLGSFKNKSASSSFKRVHSVCDQTVGRRKVFLEWKIINLSRKLSLTCGSNFNYYKSVHIILFLHCLMEWGTPRQPSKKISKLSFQLSVQVVCLLGQSEGKRKAFFGESKKEGHIVRLPPTVLACQKRWKVSSFVKFEIILPLLSFLLDHLTNKHRRTWISLINLWIDSKTCQK